MSGDPTSGPGPHGTHLSEEIRDELAQRVRESRVSGTGRLARAIEAALAHLDHGTPLGPYHRREITRRWSQSRSPALGVLLRAIGGDLATVDLDAGRRAELEGFLCAWEVGPIATRDALRAGLAALDRRRPLAADAREVLEELTGSWFTGAEAVRTLLAAIDGGAAPESRPSHRRSSLSQAVRAWVAAATSVDPGPSDLADDARAHPPAAPTRTRPASRRILRDALAFARDALASPSEGFRGDVQDVLVSLLGEEVEVDDEKIHGDVGQLRLVELREAARLLAEPTSLRPRCALCGEVVLPEDGKTVLVEDTGVEEPRRVTIHDDLPHCALLEFSRALRAWSDEQRFDDDQDPASDTPGQRLSRTYGRVAALLGNGDDARTAWVSCDACDAFGYGNATCWSCVAHWRWMPPEDRRALVAALIERVPGRPCGPEDVQAFMDRLSATAGPPATTTNAPSSLADYALQDAHRTLLLYHVHTDERRPYGLGDLRDAASACLGSLGSGYPPPSDDLRALRERGDKLAAFRELEAAVAALVRAIEGEDARRARVHRDLGGGEL